MYVRSCQGRSALPARTSLEESAATIPANLVRPGYARYQATAGRSPPRVELELSGSWTGSRAYRDRCQIAVAMPGDSVNDVRLPRCPARHLATVSMRARP